MNAPSELRMLTPVQRAIDALASTTHEAKIKELVASTASIVEIKNKDGRQQAHSSLMRLVETRTNITGAGKAAREDATAFANAVIAEEKRLVGLIKPEEDRLRGLRDAWDEAREAEKQAKARAEQERVEKIKERISAFTEIPFKMIGLPSSYFTVAIAEVKNLSIDDSFAEFKQVAAVVQAGAIEKLEEMHQEAIEREQRAAETEAARAEAAEREAAARAEQDRQRAIDAERVAAERAELDRQRQELEQQRAALQAEQDAKRAAEEAARAEAERKAAEVRAVEEKAARVARDLEEAAQAAARAAEERRLELIEQERIIFLENVAGIASATATVVDEAEGELEERAAARVVGELADLGWNAEWLVVSASDVGASHGRDRWFCLAWRMGYAGHFAQRHGVAGTTSATQEKGKSRLLKPADTERVLGAEVANTSSARLQIRGRRRGDDRALQQAERSELGGICGLFAPGPSDPRWFDILDEFPEVAPALEPTFRSVVNGLAFHMDDSRAPRLKCIGNGVVPASAAAAFVLLARRAGIFE